MRVQVLLSSMLKRYTLHTSVFLRFSEESNPLNKKMGKEVC